jgi:D-alanyl-D-alanine carboxypeptidase/D-alanyl-D-alanine-endopeptidase (penicillin-binding protein 4)
VRQELVRQLGPETASAIVQVEGAGLSRDNRVTGRAMLQLLARFRPHAELLKKEHGALLKTGTLTGVSNYAGYLADGKPFVILLNQSGNQRAAVLEQLARQYGTIAGGAGAQTQARQAAANPASSRKKQ